MDSQPLSVDSLALEGEQKVSQMVEAAQDILARLQEVMSGSTFWLPPRNNPSLRTDLLGTPGSLLRGDNGPNTVLSKLEAAHQNYKATAAALRSIIMQINDNAESEGNKMNGNSQENRNESDMELSQLERRATALRKEVRLKNSVVKALIDQLRLLLDDIILFQSCPLGTLN